jgi:mannose-6-phosphate isomerase-like protein (cupin superfamily)
MWDYIIEGTGTMVIEGEDREVGGDQVVYIPPMHWQHLANTGEGDLRFICIVDPAWREEDEELR